MKNLTFLLSLLICGITGFAQQRQDPEVYLNSEQINYPKYYINENRIDSVRIIKESGKGAIYILTNDRKFTSLTLADLLRKHTDIKQMDNTLLFQIQGKIINDIEGVRIDDTYFIYVEVKDLSGVKYLKDSLRGMKIVSIDLEKQERKPVIMIRGNKDITTNENVH
ncbi:MAG TPA: hypothetical protein VFG54_02890 [Prolixibacteraceae bacterium]|nr:hypothetical protein [Prolixibacteraceae bacterium]